MKKIRVKKHLLLIILFITLTIQAQPVEYSEPDSTKYTQYRRGVELNENMQSYEEKYFGKNLDEEKRRLFPLNNGTTVWTELNPKVPRVIYVGIHFVNKDTGWAVGDLGAVIKTTDGGESWSVKETNTTKPILKVRSYNGQIVIASGYDGLILRSTDAGETFNQVPSGVGDLFDLWGLEMINDTLGWACGATALLNTTDGGENWEIVNTPGYTGNLWWVEFMNESYGFIAADGKVLRTTDGGNNWEIIQAGNNKALYSIDLIDSLHIAAAGYGGTGYGGKNIYSSDGGYTWIVGDTITYETVNDIKYVNRDTGYVVMRNISGWKTTNRGQEWTGMAIGGEYEMQLFEEENIGYSAGTGLRIYKTENGYENWQRLIMNDNFSDVFFVSEQKGFVISGRLYRTADGGINWERVSGAPGGGDLHFLDSLTGFIARSPIYKTTDGGESWYETNMVGVTGGVTKLFFINSATGWAIANNISSGEILKTTDGGENWFVQFANTYGRFTSIHFADSLYGWATKASARPYKTTDGGNNWIQQTNLDIWHSLDIYFKDSLNGFILESNKLYKTTDGGLTWILNPDITGYSIAAKFSYYGDSLIFITGYTTFRTTNAGEDWVEIDDLNGIRINRLNLLNEGFGFAVGEFGLILNYFDSTYVPVELISFQGESTDNNVILNWQTASELNNKGFEVERLKDYKISRLQNWEKIGFVEGNGTTTLINHYNFTDKNLTTGKYQYRLKQIDYDGSFEYSNVIEIEIGAPDKFELSQNYPNPFNPSTIITYQIPTDEFVTLKVYDILGKEVAALVNENLEAGNYSVEFNASHLPSGIYFYKITSSIYTATKKLILIK